MAVPFILSDIGNLCLLEVHQYSQSSCIRCCIYEIAYLLGFICNPDINTLSAVTAIWGLCRARGIWVAQHTVPRWCWKGDGRLVSAPILSTSGLFPVYVVPRFLHFCVGDFAVWNAHKCGVEVRGAVFLRAGSLWCAWWRNVCEISFVRAWVIVPLAVSPVPMNQQYKWGKIKTDVQRWMTIRMLSYERGARLEVTWPKSKSRLCCPTTDSDPGAWDEDSNAYLRGYFFFFDSDDT